MRPGTALRGRHHGPIAHCLRPDASRRSHSAPAGARDPTSIPARKTSVTVAAARFRECDLMEKIDMNRTLAMGIVAALGIAGLSSADPFPRYTDGHPNVQAIASPCHSATIASIHGGGWSAVVGVGRSVTNGTLNATRMLDAADATGAAGSNFMLEGTDSGMAGVTDQIRQDGFVAATARARCAALDREFGCRPSDDGGTNEEWLFSADESGIDPAGAAAVTDPLPQADVGGVYVASRRRYVPCAVTASGARRRTRTTTASIPWSSAASPAASTPRTAVARSICPSSMNAVPPMARTRTPTTSS